MSVATQRGGGGGGGYVDRAPGGGSSSLADVVELILDKGLVIDIFVRVSRECAAIDCWRDSWSTAQGASSASGLTVFGALDGCASAAYWSTCAFWVCARWRLLIGASLTHPR